MKLIQGIYAPYIKQYLEFKRSLGFKLRDVDYTLSQFAELTIERSATSIGITKELADAWCKKRPNESDGTRYNRVSNLSLFARFLTDIGFPSYVPEVPRFKTSFVPYIFTARQISLIFRTTDCFVPDYIKHDSSFLMMPTLFRMLYGAGLRISEALSLKNVDIDLISKCLIVRESKNGTERMVPISNSLAKACGQYIEQRKARLVGKTESSLFFVKNDNSSCSKGIAYKALREILWQAGIPHKGKGFGPRLQDFRHTFACHSLAAMVESGLDLYHTLPILSMYLGHRTLESTNKYVRMTSEIYPELLINVSEVCAYVFPKLNNEEKL